MIILNANVTNNDYIRSEYLFYMVNFHLVELKQAEYIIFNNILVTNANNLQVYLFLLYHKIN
jgi:hypothetical protein